MSQPAKARIHKRPCRLSMPGSRAPWITPSLHGLCPRRVELYLDLCFIRTLWGTATTRFNCYRLRLVQPEASSPPLRCTLLSDLASDKLYETHTVASTPYPREVLSAPSANGSGLRAGRTSRCDGEEAPPPGKENSQLMPPVGMAPYLSQALLLVAKLIWSFPHIVERSCPAVLPVIPEKL